MSDQEKKPLPSIWEEAWPLLNQLWAERSEWNERISKLEKSVIKLGERMVRGFHELQDSHTRTQQRLDKVEESSDQINTGIRDLHNQMQNLNQSYAAVLSAHTQEQQDHIARWRDSDKRQREFVEGEAERMKKISDSINDLVVLEKREDKWRTPARAVTIVLLLCLLFVLLVEWRP